MKSKKLRRAWAAVLIGMFVAAPGPAAADGTADEADLQFRLGKEEFRKGNHESALAHFFASNRLAPNRNVLFNIASTYEALQRYADAHRYYVDALSGETDERKRADVTQALKDLSPKVAVLDIVTDPPGATLYINRKDLGSVGRAPRPLALAPGKYKVIAALEGYETATSAEVEVAQGKQTKVSLSLAPIVGTVQASVEGAPAATVHVDDEQAAPVCTAPCTFDIAPGRHILHFKRDGFQPALRQINVVTKETTKAVATLSPLTGTVVVQADERDAVVEVDGKPAGFTPAVIQGVAVGKRTVRVTLRGYAPIEREVVVKPNEQSQLLDMRLVPLRQVAAASRFTENIEDAPSSVTIIDGQELRAFGYPTIAESLRGVRGVSLNNDRVYWSAQIRGLGEPNDYGNRLLVLQDGTVMNDNILSSSYIGSDGRVDLGDVDRIEVVRGPGSLVYGTGAMSGVVNIVPRAKEDETRAHVGVGTYDNQVAHARAGFHLNFNKAKTAGMWASVSGARSNGIDAEVEPVGALPGTTATARQVGFFRSFGTAGRAWVGPLTAQWFYHQRNEHIPIGVFGTRFNDARTLYRDQRFMGEIRVEPKISDKVQILARAHANHYHFHGVYAYDPAPLPGVDEDLIGTWFGGEARAVITPVPSLRLTVGGEAQGHPEADMFGCSGYDANGGRCLSAEEDPENTYLDIEQSFVTGAAYGLVDWGATKWFRVSAGVRGDFSTIKDPQIVARGALIFKPWTGGVIKLMGGNAFRYPSIYERFYYDGVVQVQSENPDPASTGGGPYVPGGLKAETSVTGEVEISQRFLEDWIGLLSVHAIRVEQIITSVEVNPNTGVQQPGSGVVQYQNSPSPQLTAGFDVELRREWRQGWMMSAMYGFQKAQYIDVPAADAVLASNPRVTNAPEHLASFRGVVPLVPELASLGARITLEAPRRLTLSSDETTPGAAVADLTLSGSAKRFGVSYVVGVYNITDQRYSLPTAEGYFGRSSPQLGRTFLANVNISYP